VHEPGSHAGVKSGSMGGKSSRAIALISAMRALALVFSAAAGGCTTTHIHSDQGVTTLRGFGVTRIEPPADAATLVTDTRGLGIVMSRDRLTVGWLNEQAVTLRDTSRCQAIFMAATPADALAIKRVLGAADHDVHNVCFFSKGASNEK